MHDGTDGDGRWRWPEGTDPGYSGPGSRYSGPGSYGQPDDGYPGGGSYSGDRPAFYPRPPADDGASGSVPNGTAYTAGRAAMHRVIYACLGLALGIMVTTHHFGAYPVWFKVLMTLAVTAVGYLAVSPLRNLLSKQTNTGRYLTWFAAAGVFFIAGMPTFWGLPVAAILVAMGLLADSGMGIDMDTVDFWRRNRDAGYRLFGGVFGLMVGMMAVVSHLEQLPGLVGSALAVAVAAAGCFAVGPVRDLMYKYIPFHGNYTVRGVLVGLVFAAAVPDLFWGTAAAVFAVAVSLRIDTEHAGSSLAT